MLTDAVIQVRTRVHARWRVRTLFQGAAAGEEPLGKNAQ